MTTKKPCDICGGTGQINFFQGVSRFLLTVEECPECAGTGQQLEPENSKEGKTAEREHQENEGKPDK